MFQGSKVAALLSIAVFVADRILKWYALHVAVPHAAGIFSFGYFLNPALFFFPAWRFITWLAFTTFVVLFTFFLVRIKTHHLTPNTWSLIPILLGGGSNVFDRFVYDGVIDYVEILGLATLNLADILILLGLFALIFNSKRYVQRS